MIAEAITALFPPTSPAIPLLGATPDGRDIAGILSASLGWGVLVNATAVAWADGSPVVEMSTFGGRLITTSRFTGEHGIVTLRPNAVTAEPASSAGTVAARRAGAASLPAVTVSKRVAEAGAVQPRSRRPG